MTPTPKDPVDAQLTQAMIDAGAHAWMTSDTVDPAKVWHAMQSARALAAVPAGFVLVPVELTEAMEDAGEVHIYAPTHRNDLERIWAAMLAAAPSPSAVQPPTAPEKNAQVSQIGEMAIDEVAARHAVQVAGVRAVLNPTAFASDVLSLVGARIVDDYEDAVHPLSEAQHARIEADEAMMRQALDVLDGCEPEFQSERSMAKYNAAITAIRSRLETK